MGIGFSVLLIAVGAVLKFALYERFDIGINLSITGIILMVVGAIGLIVSLIATASQRRSS